MTRLLVIEDHPITARATAAMLRSLIDGPVALEVAHDLAEVKARLRGDRYDLVFVDLVLPGAEGTQALGWVRQLAPRARVIVLSGHDEPLLVRQCFALGAFAFVFKGMREQALEQAIRAALGGSPTWPKMADEAHRAAPDWPGRLTARERDVLTALVRTQQSTKGLARALAMTPGTVKTHLNSIMKKSGLHNRSELIVAARDLGFVGPTIGRRSEGQGTDSAAHPGRLATGWPAR